MQCTPEQIEEKRRQAQLKLARKNAERATSAAVNQNGVTQIFSRSVPNAVQRSPDIFSRKSSGSSVGPMLSSPKAATSHMKPYEKPVIQFYGDNKVVTGTCSLISEDRFTVEIAGFSMEAVKMFKTIPSRSYDSKTKLWDFALKDYDQLMQKMLFLQPDVVIGRIPNFVINTCHMPPPDLSLIDLSSIDSELLSALLPFQTEGVCFGIDKSGRCLIADDMGLGKTFQALAIADYYKDDWPMLIVTTASMKNVWEETIHKYLPRVSVMHTQYMISAKDYIGDARVLIVSHDLMSRCSQKLVDRNFGVIIIDESHTLKNFKTKCTKAATSLCKEAKRVILLSGTPALSKPSELYTQLSLIDDRFFGNFMDYSRRYCDGKKTPFGWDANGRSNLKELGIILAKKFMIRRTKEDVLKLLPTKTQEVISLDVKLSEISTEDKRNLIALAAKYSRNSKAAEKHAALLTYFAETARLKIPSVCSYILQVLGETNKFIIFAHHQIMLNAIEQILLKTNKKYIRIDGHTASLKRKELVDTFQLNDECKCALLSITAANAGITLTAAKSVIFAELHWNPSILSQAESRAHRFGQDSQVNVKYLLAEGTADDYVWPMLQKKQKTLNDIGLCKDHYENVRVSKQLSSKSERIAECLNSSLTAANTLDISSYFMSVQEENGGDAPVGESQGNEDIFNDGFEEIMADLDF